MNVKFKLKEPNQNKPTLILLKAYVDSKRLVYSTGQKVEPKYWNPKKMRTNRAKGYSSEYADLDTWLDHLETEIKKTSLKIKNEGRKPSIHELKLSLDTFTNNKTNDESISLFGFIESFIEERERNPRYSKGTTKNYVTHFNNLKEFAENRVEPITFEDINLQLFNELLAFYTKKGHSANHKHKQIQTLKVFLNEAYERGLTTNLNHNKKWYKVKKEHVQNFSLEENDLKELYQYYFTDNIKLDKVRDLFLIGCFTGLRFSDFNELKPSNIKTKDDGRDYIILKTVKTKDILEIPINGYVKAILDKYNSKPPRGISNQKMNEYLKEVFTIIGIKRKVSVSQYDSKGKMFEANLPISEIISTHCARRSFATIAYKNGVSTIDIMQITGHKKESTFLKYINITKEDTAKRLASNPFFSLKINQEA